MSKKIHKIIYHVSVLYVIKLLNNQIKRFSNFMIESAFFILQGLFLNFTNIRDPNGKMIQFGFYNLKYVQYILDYKIRMRIKLVRQTALKKNGGWKEKYFFFAGPMNTDLQFILDLEFVSYPLQFILSPHTIKIREKYP